MKTSLNRIDKYRNPGVATIGEYLDRNGYDATGVVKNPTAIVRLDDIDVFQPLAWLYRWRENVQREIDNRFSAETAGVLDAALLGNRYNLSRTTAERFRDGGTFHVLVISGLHISFIGGIVFLLTRRFTRKRILQCLISSLVVWGYTIAVGAQASVVRAALMFTFVALGAVVFRTGSALNALGGAALILLIKSPKDLFDPSFQLTCLSVLAIVTLAWPLIQTFQAIGYWRPTRGSPHPPSCSALIRTVCESLYWSEVDWQKEMDREPYQYRLFKTSIAILLERVYLQRLLRYIFNAILVSGSVQIVLLPLLIVYFHRVSLSSLILNIVIGLLLAVLGFVALAALLISQLNVAIASPLITLANGIDWIMVHGVDPFTSIGLASLRLPEYTGWSRVIYFLYYAPLVPLLAALSRWRPLQLPTSNRRSRQKLILLTVLLQASLLTTLLLQPFSASRPDGKLHVDFLDVGQGDAALVTMPNGATVLVDGGGRPSFASAPKTGSVDGSANSFERESRSIGEMVTSEFLWWRGLDSVDYVLATHADADHIDGLNDVVRNFSVRSALVARTPADDAEYIKFAETLKATKTPVEVVQAGDELHFGDVTATVLWPSVSSDPNAPSRNNDSVVLRLQFGERSILLTGDIEKEGEAQILSSNATLHADVVRFRTTAVTLPLRNLL